MATTIVIICPNCKKQLKGPAELQGKHIRCKACSHIFAVPAPAQSKPVAQAEPAEAKSAPPKSSPSAPAKVRKPSSTSQPAEKPDDSAGSYVILKETGLAPRCPQCAFELEPGQIICLHCGYNNETRTRHHTVKTIETTAAERIVWLTPGILCVISIIIAIGLACLLWIGLKDNDAYWVLPLQIWGSVMLAFESYIAGRFAVKRLIFNPNPPEKIKR